MNTDKTRNTNKTNIDKTMNTNRTANTKKADK